MADLMTALRNADAAGDTEAAQRIAAMIKAQESQVQTVEVPQAISPEPAQEPSFLDKVIGGAEGFAQMGTGMLATPVAGIVGLADAANPFSPEGSGGNRVKQIQEALTYQPRTQEGKAAIEPVQKVGEKIQEFNQFLGDDTYAATGSPFLSAAATALPEATLSLLGVRKAATPQQAALARSTKSISKGVENISPTKKKIGELIQQGEKTADTAPYEIVNNIEKGTSKLIGDKAAQSAIKQGFDPGVVAVIKGASKIDKIKMKEMVSILEKSKKDAKFGVKNRPSNVAGDSLLERFKYVKQANREAGQSLDKVAQSLKGNKIDKAPIISEFADSLDSMGVKFDNSGRPIFKGSDIEGLGGSMKAVKQITNRLKSVKTSDAYELHRLKRFIDENVTYGKSGEGLKGSAERVLKQLRASIDNALDSNFQAYDKVNQKYSDTIQALNGFQDVAGKKMNLAGSNADKAVGTLLRRLMGNAQSRVQLIDAIDSVDSVAAKYGGKFNDDLLSQVLLVDELDTVFGPAAKTSLLGDISKSATNSPTATLAAANAAKTTAKRLAGPTPEKAIKAIKELLDKQ